MVWPGSGMFGGWWTGHILAATVFWVGFTIFVVWSAQRLAHLHSSARYYRSRGAGILSAVTILQERYARGEIGREEFIEKQRDLVATAYRDAPEAQMTEVV